MCESEGKQDAPTSCPATATPHAYLNGSPGPHQPPTGRRRPQTSDRGRRQSAPICRSGGLSGSVPGRVALGRSRSLVAASGASTWAGMRPWRSNVWGAGGGCQLTTTASYAGISRVVPVSWARA